MSQLSTKPVTTPFPWKPGQHLALVGGTGSGKSTLAERILENRKYVIVVRTKDDDVKYRSDVKVTKVGNTAAAIDDVRNNRIEIAINRNEYDQQAEAIRTAIAKVWKMGGFTIYFDELWLCERKLKLTSDIEKLLTQGRSLGVSVVLGMQRPSQISRFALSQASHVVSFRTEGRDLLTLKQAFGPRMAEVETLPKHHFLWYSIDDRATWTGQVQELQSNAKGSALPSTPQGKE